MIAHAVLVKNGVTAAPGSRDEARVWLVPPCRANMRPNSWADTLVLGAWRRRIEALYSHLEVVGTQWIRARTNPGRPFNLRAALLAAAIINAD